MRKVVVVVEGERSWLWWSEKGFGCGCGGVRKEVVPNWGVGKKVVVVR